VLAVAELKQNSEVNKIIRGMQQQPANKNDRWLGLAMNAALHSHPPLQSKAAESAVDKKAKSKIDQVIVINVVKNVMKFDKELIEVKAGSTIQIRLNNPDFMQHNLLVLKPHTMEKVGKAADQLAAAPEGEKMHYVPDMPEVIAATPLVDPEGSYTLTVKVPAQPGDYPYICSFPGHWRIMKGMMKVK
jgi:azurin